MKIGEEDLSVAQQRDLRRLRSFTFDDELGGGEDLGRTRDDRRSGGLVGGIVETRSPPLPRSPPPRGGRDGRTSRTLPGTSPTRYSWVFTSRGTPISIAGSA